MRIIYLFFLIIVTTNSLVSNEVFDTKEYELVFSSNNKIFDKEKKINEIKIKSFQNLVDKLLTKKNKKKLKTI